MKIKILVITLPDCIVRFLSFFKGKGKNKVLALYSAGAELPELQPHNKQPDHGNKIQQSESAVRHTGMYSQRPV